VAVATLSRAKASSTLARPWACLRRSARRLFQSGMHTDPALAQMGRFAEAAEEAAGPWP